MLPIIMQSNVLTSVRPCPGAIGLRFIASPLYRVLGTVHKSVYSAPLAFIVLPIANEFTTVCELRFSIAMARSVFPLADVLGAVSIFHAALSIGAITVNALGKDRTTEEECQKKGCGIFHCKTS